MSHSVVKDFPTQTDNTLILVVNKNGELSVDKETLDGYAKLGNSQVSILRVDNDDGSTVDMTLDTFHPTDTMEELTISVEDELIRNYNSFRMDHCYTPLTSPSQQKPPVPPDPVDDDLELDDLAHTLSILDGTDPVPAKIKPKTNDHKDLHQKVELLNSDNNKVTLLNKVNKLGGNKVYKSVKTVLKGAKVIKKPEIHPPADSESDDDDDDDLNDSDFEFDESPIKKQSKRPANKRRSKLENELHNDARNKVIKVRKGVKQIVYKTPPKIVESKVEPAALPTPEIVKSPEIKKQPKKEKKVPKQIDDGIALFSTPDIIRRVGSGKSGERLPDGLDSPTKIKAAKIEDRSKSESGRHSTETKIKHPHRHSLDSKGPHVVIDKTKVDTLVKHSERDRERERRMSNVSDKSSTDVNSFNNEDSITNHNESFDSISEAVGNLENVIGVGATPTTEMIRSIIHTNEPTAPMDAVPPVSTVDQSQLNLDSAALDIDQNILDNINAEELIPEDILYQVAKLVENPDVQNVIDRTLVDLEPTIQQAPLTEQQSVAHAPIVPSVSVNQNVHVPISNSQPVTPKNTPKPIQIIRSDGRVVTLPPIEKPATRSSKKRQETQIQSPVQHPPPPTPTLPSPPVQQPQQPQQQQQLQQPVVPQPVPHAPKIQAAPKVQKPLTLPLADEFIVDDTAAGEGDTDSDESWNSEDDPDRLWCICKQPHNNRFMICCDTCEDWFHGKCVNVTKAMGQQMEQQGKEWQCPNCVKKVNAAVSSTSSIPNVSHPKPARIPPDSMAKRKSTESGSSCIVCSSPARANSVYCSDTCILKHAQGVEKETNKAQKSAPQRIIVFERSTGKCLSGPNAPTANNLKQWLREHPGFEVVRPVNKAKQQNQNMVQSKLQLVKNPHGKDGVGLAVQRKGVQVGVLPHAAKQPNTIKLIPPTKMVPGAKTSTPKQQTQQTSPNKKLVQTTLKSPTIAASSTPSVTPDKPKPITPTSKSKIRERKQKLQTPETPRQSAQENIRETVKKTLLEQLLARLKEVEDIKLGEEEVDKMATEIETQLYKLFGDSGPKYRAKYRSLIFNIKDPKNQTLWRRICEKTISPHQLVRLSPEEMASQELARWREQENKHQLDMIKKSELEMLTINRKYVLKTHKGEQVMEDRPSVKVDSTEIMPGLGADSTSEHDTTAEKEKSDHNSDHSSERRSSSKHSRRDRDRDKRTNKEKGRDRSSSKDRKNKDHSSKSSSRSKRSRSRDRDRDRSSHKSDRKRSRSRDRHHRSSYKSSRHKRDKHSTEHLDKKSREILDNLENNKIVPPPEDRLWKHVPQQDIQEITPDSDSDHEPTSTVTIPTPPRSTEQEDTQVPKKEEPVVVPSTAKPETKVEAVPAAPPRLDPRINRETSIDTPPESESSQLQTTPTPTPTPTPTLTLSSNNSPSPAASSVSNTPIWEGHINMADVAKFFISLHEVSGDCVGLDSELTSTLDIVGRITPETVWDYIGKMKRSNSKLISVLRLTAGNVEEQMQYIALFTYLSNRKRFGVIKTPNSAIKDFYIMPLASHTPIPQALLPLSGPGFKENRPDLLLGIVVRAKRKRPNPIDIISSGPLVKRSRLEDSPNISQSSISSTPAPQPPRSYTPPPTRDPRIRLPTIPTVSATLPNDDDEPYSPEDSDPESIPVILQKTTKPPISSVSSAAIAAATAVNIKTGDLASVLTATAKSSSFLETSSTVTSFEPFSNKFDGIPGLDETPPTNAALIQKQLEELNKCIEQQKDEINSISQNLASTTSTSVASNLSNINLPSNLQQILDSIKNIPSTNVAVQDTEEYCPSAPGYKTAPGDTDDLTIPLMLPKLSSRTQSSRPTISESLSSSTSTSTSSTSTIPLKLPLPNREIPVVAETLPLPNLSVPPPVVALPNTHIPPPIIPNTNVPPPLSTGTIPLNLPKAKTKINTSPPTPIQPVIQPPGTSPVIIPDSLKSSTDKATSSVLSSLSEEELIRKAAEMLGEAEEPEKEDSPEPEETAGGDVGKFPVVSQSMKCAPVMYTAPAAVGPTPPKRTKIDPSQPPVPGLEDEFET